MHQLAKEVKSYVDSPYADRTLSKPAYAMLKSRLKRLLGEQQHGSEDETITAEVLRIISECEVADDLLRNEGHRARLETLKERAIELVSNPYSPGSYIRLETIRKELSAQMDEVGQIMNELEQEGIVERASVVEGGGDKALLSNLSYRLKEGRPPQTEILLNQMSNWFHAMWRLDDYGYHDLKNILEYHPSQPKMRVIHALKLLEEKGTIESKPGNGWRWAKG